VLRRTLERSQKARPKANRWSWGGALNTNTPNTDRRSVSTMNLSKHTDPVITKRLSSSSATLLHSPDRGTSQKLNIFVLSRRELAEKRRHSVRQRRKEREKKRRGRRKKSD
uniref:Uncharacterized protein n=1 Tax=Periophthalmus magnuspinnatus TaxID=409849 RepID=A0A3B4AX60_9GOBI